MVHGKLVYLQAVVVAPLLSLMLDAVLAHHHAVVAQTANGWFRLSRADGHSLHAGDTLKGLHQRAREMLLQVVVAYLHSRLRRAHLEVTLSLSANRNALQYDCRVVRRYTVSAANC